MQTDYTPTASPKNNTLALVSMISSFAGLLFLCFSFVLPFCSCISGLVALAAVVTGFIARQQIKSTGENGDGMALTGMIVGGIQVVLVICGIIFVVILSALGMLDQVMPNLNGILK